MLTRGIDVSFIVGDYGQPEIERLDGITLIKSFTPMKGYRKLRFLPDMLAIRRAMTRADADVYNQRSTAFFTGQLAFFAARLGKTFTFSAGSDYNCYPDCGGTLPGPMAALYRYGIRRASAVIAQTEKQRRLMEENFHRDIVLIRNGIPIPESPLVLSPGHGTTPEGIGMKDGRPDFLWVGSLRRMKRAELFIELARRVPEARFTLIGGKFRDADYSREIVEAARATQNLRHIEFVPPGEIDSYYAAAYALVNTSSLEGFPNTYLHAWVHGAPVLTAEIDPDDLISRHSLGIVGGTFEGLVAAVRTLASDRALRGAMSERASAYVRAHHDIRERGNDYLKLFERLVATRASSSSRRAG